MRRILVFLAAAMLAVTPLMAVDTSFWQIGSYDEFMQGTLRDVSLNREGLLRLAPETRDVFNPDETLALSLAADQNKNIFIGTGHQGKVFKVDASGKGSLFFTAREAEIFGLAAGKDGELYVASSPEGKIYRVAASGESTVFSSPSVKYIWALAFDAKGNLFAGTGDEGKILKFDSSGKSEVFFDSKQSHIMCLTFDRDGNLLAGSVPNGLIYRIHPQGKAFVLYQSTHPEIHDVAVDQGGRIFAAALGSASGKSTPSLFPPTAPQGPAQGGVTTITVTASADDTAKNPQETQTQGQPAGNAQAGGAPAQTPAFPVARLAQGRGSLILIRPDNTVETVWSSNSESIFGLAVRGNQVLFSTDANGRIFELDPEKEGSKVTLLAQTRETLATRLLLQGSDLYIATSNIARLFRLTGGMVPEGTYESPVKDTKFVSQWGNLSWRAEVPAAAALEFFTRSGNSERPDSTWSDWSGPLKRPAGDLVLSPAARFLQWKAVFKANGKSSPNLSDVTVSYRNQNLPPQIRTVNVVSPGDRSGGSSSSSGSSGNISVTSGSSSSGSGAAAKSATILSWQAEDPNGDSLTYSVYLRGEDEREWHLLKDDLRQPNYTLESSALGDGKYVTKIVASDEPSNPMSMARRAELVSSPFWFDNTPPSINIVKSEATPRGVEVQFQVRDGASFIRQAQVSVDGGDWAEIISDDGIVDSSAETFTLKPASMGEGEHVILLRAFDATGNAGVGKAVVRIEAGKAPTR